LAGVSQSAQPTGVLLVNLGSPDAPEPGAVRRYLREFLGDPRVLDMPAPARWLLLHAVILPFRPRRSAAQYASIWTPQGSPLVVHGRALAEALGKRLGDGFRVELAMRYGRPSVAGALDALARADVGRIVAVPLFPQYASSSSGSALEHVYALASTRWNVPPLEVVPPFFDDPGFVAALAACARPVLAELRPNFVLFSYHGLPERQVRKSDPSGSHCLASPACCDAIGPANRFCYRAQCLATTRAVAAELGLAPDRHSTAFQSRLGRTPWIAPYTDRVLPELAARGVRRLAVLCPSFVADCLETLEEIGVRAREQWLGLGGEALALVPCVNAHPVWVEALAAAIESPARRPEASESATATPSR
jgi:ferrochelatase